jgi:hypothetical protein
VDKGKDFGSSDVRTIKAPKVALLGGAGTSSLNFGELWYFFEQELDYPVSIIEADMLGRMDLNGYDVVIMPSSYGSYLSETNFKKVMDWVKAGGKLIAIENALMAFADKEGFDLSKFDTEEEKKAAEKVEKEIQNVERLEPYQERERMGISTTAAGAVYELKLDQTHPLTFGMGEKFYTLKNNGSRYSYLNNGVNAGIIQNNDSY